MALPTYEPFTLDPPGDWFCLAHPFKCVAEGPERNEAAPHRCPKCGAQVGVTVFEDDQQLPGRSEASRDTRKVQREHSDPDRD